MKILFFAALFFAACAHKPSNQEGTTGSTGSTGGSTGSNTTGSTGSLTTFQNAEVVIGQADFTSNAAPTTVSAATSDATRGSAAFDGKNLFLPDTLTNRVLGFSSLPTTNGASATTIFGQPTAGANAPGATSSAWYLPQSIHTDGTTLAIADTGNHRVLLLPANSASGASASIVVGWPDMSTPSNGCAANVLESPASAFIANGMLFVADRLNNRVLIWKTVPTANGASADLVLGQTHMNACVSNDSLHNGTVNLRTASTLNGPTDVWSDGTRVIVTDSANNRVLVWSSFPTANGVAADEVIGQTTFGLARNDATALYQPASIAYAGAQFFIADAGHNRVLGWNALPTATTGASADFVFGQSDLSHTAANDDAQAGTAGAAPTARTLSFPSGVAFAGNAVVVSDTANRRFLIFAPHF